MQSNASWVLVGIALVAAFIGGLQYGLVMGRGNFHEGGRFLLGYMCLVIVLGSLGATLFSENGAQYAVAVGATISLVMLGYKPIRQLIAWHRFLWAKQDE